MVEVGGNRNSKLKNGYETEEKFILKCLKHEISISRPIFNIEPYDFIVEKDNKFYSVQVKKYSKGQYEILLSFIFIIRSD